MPIQKLALLNSDVSQLNGQYVLAVPSGAATTIAAGTSSAGHIFSMRFNHASKKVLLRYVAAQFTLTTAFGAAQEVGCELFVARSFSASPTGATVVDTGGTVTNTNKVATQFDTSAVADCRVASTGAMTAGTMTLDANAIGSCSGYAGAVGVVIAKTDLFTAKTHMPSRGPDPASYGMSPILLASNEGIIIRNTVLMGASGVGRWQFFVEWDEVTP